MKRIGLVVGFFSMLSYPTYACEIKSITEPVNITVNGNNRTYPFMLKFNSDIADCTNIFLTFTSSNTSSYNGKFRSAGVLTIPYIISSDQNGSFPIKSYSTLSNAEKFTPIKNTQLYINLDGVTDEYSLPFGVHTDTFNFFVYRGTNVSSAVLLNGFTVAATINVPPRIDLSLVDTGASFNLNDTVQNLNFGELEENEQLSADLVIRSNGKYTISLSSQNSWALLNSIQNDRITYSFYLNDQRLDGPGSSNIIYDAFQNNSFANRELRYRLMVKIGPTEGRASGNYSDVIVVTTTTKL